MKQKDIVTREDLTVLVDSFYEKVKSDSLLGPVFSEFDWPNHLPVMYNFWCSMMLGERSYQGNPLQAHMHLAITAVHFERWITLFTTTVDSMFTGERAEEIKMRARSIAGIFQFKMGLTTSA